MEQKRIFVNLRENTRGRYLRIAEVTGNNRSTIIIPSSGLVQFRTLLDDFIQNDSAVALGQQAMLPDSSVPFGLDMGKRKKRGNKADGEPQPSEDDDKRIFVGNLAWSTTGQVFECSDVQRHAACTHACMQTQIQIHTRRYLGACKRSCIYRVSRIILRRAARLLGPMSSPSVPVEREIERARERRGRGERATEERGAINST